MSSEERRRREKYQRREYVIEVAFKFFCDGKFEEVTMDEIARKADLTKTTLYSYFKDKESLLFAIINKGKNIYINIINEELEKNINNSNSSRIRNARIRFIREYPNFVQNYIYYRTKYCLKENEILREEFIESINFLQSYYENEVFEYELKIKDGTYNSSLNPVVIFTFLLVLDIGIYDPFIQKTLNNFKMSTTEFYLEANKLLDDMLVGFPSRIG